MVSDTLKAMQHDPWEFRRRLLIDANGQPQRLGRCLDPWQARDFAALDNGWRRVVGVPLDPARGVLRRGYLERGRGHSKTCDLAVMSLWALFASTRPLSGIAAAADRDQARLLRDAIRGLVQRNRWLLSEVVDADTGRRMPLLDVQVNRVRNAATGSELSIIASDAATSYGLTPHFVIVDELTHWPAAGHELFTSLASAWAKRAECMVVAISNAGVGQGVSWQWKVREAVRQDPTWHFSRLDGPVASWITADRLDEQQRLLPPKAYKRLWLNQWTTEAGDALEQADVEACVTQPGPMPCPIEDYWYVGSLDLGIKHDHSALVVLAVDWRERRVILASCQSWNPAHYGGTLRLGDVELAVLDAQRRFGLAGVLYDPWQAEFMAEQLRARGVRMVAQPITPKSQDEMATELLQVFRNRTLRLYRDEALLRDLMRLTIVERANGTYRLQATRDEHGHADRAMAMAMALPVVTKLAKHLLFGWHNQTADEERFLAAQRDGSW